jgi:mycoredoxin
VCGAGWWSTPSTVRSGARNAREGGLVALGMSQLTVYVTSWCPFCILLATDLDRAGIPFEAIDVDEDRHAAALVAQLNNGNRTVPTVVFADGSAMTNPPVARVRQKLGV